MAENVVDQIFSDLRQNLSECTAVRLVGHTPKTEYYIYEAVLEFPEKQERISAKIYRSKGKQSSNALARREYENLLLVQQAFEKRKMTGAPQPLGDFSELGAVVTLKVPGLPLQSIIMKAALLPGYADHKGLRKSASAAGEWLRSFHKTLAQGAIELDTAAVLKDLEAVAKACKREGLEDGDMHLILSGAEQSLAKAKKTTAASAVLHEFTPLNISLCDGRVFLCDYSGMDATGMALLDVAHFMAAIEALEKYPFCNREITSSMQEDFLAGYGVTASDRALVRVLKMRELLRMFAAGRNVKDAAVRKKVMWANVMKKFIHEAANRTLSRAA